MILVVNLEDADILKDAYKFDKYPKETFGVAVCYVPKLDYSRIERQEDLFITAHGNKNEIGDKSLDGLGVSAGELAAFLHQKLLPGNYQGRIFLSTCDSAPKYSKALYLALLEAHPDVSVFGMTGSVYGIGAPDDKKWIKATN